jgi:uncharacterized protein (TIGR02588 family)
VPRNWLEWLALGIGSAALVAVLAILIADGLGGGDLPPDIAIELHVEEAYETDQGWLLPATLTNLGDEAAEALDLEAVATVAGIEETSALQVDYAPSRSDVEITFGFSAAPDGEVEVRVVGFRLP